jgi:hypothetical protein
MSKLGKAEQKQLVAMLRERFERTSSRHYAVARTGLDWAGIESRLLAAPAALASLAAMDESGGEPDVTGRDAATGAVIFTDCAPESPVGRRSLCYDRAAPAGDAATAAAKMGGRLLNEAEYIALQALGAFDLKTSSWLQTPEPVRALGGALFGDRRFGRVFIYHNGAESYYAARGFRMRLLV